MPPLKQATSLERMAMQVSVNYFSSFCMHCENMDQVRRGIPFFRNENGASIPPKLAAEFYNRVLKKNEEEISLIIGKSQRTTLTRGEVITFAYTRNMEVGRKILMDQTIVGLNCPDKILESLLPDEVCRIQGFTRLELDDRLPYSLGNMHLEHLTVFAHQYDCTDSDLQLIGANCPKLTHVHVAYSRHAVTDAGLAALAPCPDLEFLSVTGCLRVSTVGLNHFLSVNKSVRHLSAWRSRTYLDAREDPGFDVRMDPKWEENLSVHESLELFTILEGFSDRHLLNVVSRFPNLKYIKIHKNLTVDLSIIKSLSKLSRIHYYAGDGSTWADFESVLEFFGPQIEELSVECKHFSTVRRGIDSVFRLCKNLERVYFDCESKYRQAKLVVPPFKKLKEFWCHCYGSPKLEFGEMPSLERLEACGFDIIGGQVESIIFDHKRFPKLKVIRMHQSSNAQHYDDTDRLDHIIKSNNLDLIRIDN